MANHLKYTDQTMQQAAAHVAAELMKLPFIDGKIRMVDLVNTFFGTTQFKTAKQLIKYGFMAKVKAEWAKLQTPVVSLRQLAVDEKEADNLPLSRLVEVVKIRAARELRPSEARELVKTVPTVEEAERVKPEVLRQKRHSVVIFTDYFRHKAQLIGMKSRFASCIDIVCHDNMSVSDIKIGSSYVIFDGSASTLAVLRKNLMRSCTVSRVPYVVTDTWQQVIQQLQQFAAEITKPTLV